MNWLSKRLRTRARHLGRRLAETQPGRRERSASRRDEGITLLELLVVLVILVLLAGMVAPRVIDYLGSAKTDTTKLQLESLAAALDLFRLDVGRYPTEEEGLQALGQSPPGLERWKGPYLKKTQAPLDPWGKPYSYRIPGQHGAYDLFSLGSDNAPGGDDEDQDVTNW